MKIIKNVFKRAFLSIPGGTFFYKMVKFIRHPAIDNGSGENIHLQNAVESLVKSTITIGIVIYCIKWSTQNTSLISDIELIINPLALYAMLFVRAMITAAAFGGSLALLVFLIKRKIIYTYFLQVIEAWSTLNILGLVLFWIGLNRVIETGSIYQPTSLFDQLIGAFLSIIIFILIIWLIIIPTYVHLKEHMQFKTPAIAILLSIGCVLTANSYIPTGLSNHLINKKGVCNILVKKYESKSLTHGISKEEYLLNCLQKMNERNR